MNKQNIILIVFSVLIFTVLVPTSCALNTLGGDVRDTEGVGISGATVTVIGYGSENTNSIGHYYFYDMPSGAYTVTASAPGYIDSSVGLYVIYSTYQDFTLSTVPPTPTPTMIPDPTPTPIIDSSDDWGFSSDVTAGLPSFADDTWISPAVFYDGTTRKMIVGDASGDFYGYRWTGSSWVEDSSVINGLSSLDYFASPTVFNDEGTLKLIVGHGCFIFGSSYSGYYWTGSSWVSDSSIINGDLIPVAVYQPSPAVFYSEQHGLWKLIAGDGYGTFTAFQWITNFWDDHSYTAEGLPDIGWNSKPTVFNSDGTLKLISGLNDGTFSGYYLDSDINEWVLDTQLTSGLVDIGSVSAPTVFHGSDFMLIAGTKDGEFVGFNSQFQAAPTPAPTIDPVIAIPPVTLPIETPIPVIEPTPEPLEIFFENIMTFISTPFNWLLLLFAYIGAFIGKIISKINEEESTKDILADISLFGTIGWVLPLIGNLFIPLFLIDEILIIAMFLLSGLIVSGIANLKGE